MKQILPIIIMIITILALCIFYKAAYCADYTVKATLSWDGKDSSGKAEASMPVTIGLYETATNTLKSSITVTGAVTAQAMPTFTAAVPDNQDTTLSYYATASDASGNRSAQSTPATVTIKGKDTLAPGTPVLTIQVAP